MGASIFLRHLKHIPRKLYMDIGETTCVGCQVFGLIIASPCWLPFYIIGIPFRAYEKRQERLKNELERQQRLQYLQERAIADEPPQEEPKELEYLPDDLSGF
jgi:predicted metal-binding transcription factor (methanogenesis marker protein 9)